MKIFYLIPLLFLTGVFHRAQTDVAPAAAAAGDG